MARADIAIKTRVWTRSSPAHNLHSLFKVVCLESAVDGFERAVMFLHQRRLESLLTSMLPLLRLPPALGHCYDSGDMSGPCRPLQMATADFVIRFHNCALVPPSSSEEVKLL